MFIFPFLVWSLISFSSSLDPEVDKTFRGKPVQLWALLEEGAIDASPVHSIAAVGYPTADNEAVEAAYEQPCDVKEPIGESSPMTERDTTKYEELYDMNHSHKADGYQSDAESHVSSDYDDI